MDRGSLVTQCTIDTYEGEIESVLWRVSKTQKRIGSIGFTNTIFKKCFMEGVGFAGTREAIDQIKSGINTVKQI